MDTRREERVDSLPQQCLVNLRNLSVHRAWRSKPGQIYSKTFDSNCKKDNCPQSLITYHDCKITAGATLRIYCDVKRKTVHFSISGKEQFVSTCSRQELDFCYGFMHLRCDDNDSEIQITFLPAFNYEGTNSFVLVAIAN